MLPSRGLRPAQFVPLAARQSTLVRCNASRQFSSLPRTSRLPTPSSRTTQLHSARWRTGATANSHAVLTPSFVRYGSWYAPWSWGKPSAPGPNTVDPASVPSGVEQVPIAEFSSRPVSELAKQQVEHVVTTATPELAPAGIDKPAVVDHATDTTYATLDGAATNIDTTTLDELLNANPTKDVVPKPEFDPTQLIDHAGQLKELGLDYGWGITTVFERMIEQIYLISGWGWAGSIVTAGVAVRIFTFYFQALSSNQMAKMASLGPVTKPIQEKMEAAIARGDKQQEQLYRMQQAEIMKPYMGGMASMGGFMLVQAWVGFSAFRFLRAMAELPVPGMAQDGFLWFSDLSARDPYFILPAATTAIMYAVFKTGGEVGVQQDVGQAAQRQKLFTGLAIILGLVTAFQASALQLYFLTSGVLGGITGYLLRQNGFRRMLNISILPSKESNALYTKVAKGELKLNDIKAPDGKIRYQAPKPLAKPHNRRGATTLSDINIKPGAPIPAHLRPAATTISTEAPDRDVDFEEGTKDKPIGEKLSYYRRNYRLSFMYRRLKNTMESFTRKAGYGGPKMTKEQERRKRRAEEYEIERRRRFENRQ